MEEVNPGINKSLLTSIYWMLRQTCIYEKKKKKKPTSINVNLVIAKPIFPTKGRR